MMFQRLNESDPERIFVSVKNSYSTATLTAGQWAAYDLVTDQDGVGVTKPVGASRSFVAGVCIESIAHNAFGKVQVWGFRDDAQCLGGSGSLTSKLTAGQAMKFAVSGFAAQAYARTAAQVNSAHGRRPVGICMAPTNTAALATQAGTAGQYTVMITCL